MLKEIFTMNSKHLELITALRHHLHAHPELSMQEYQTKATLMDFLRQHTNLTIVDCGHWFYAYYSCGNLGAKAIAFRADYDALPIAESAKMPIAYRSRNPGVSHKCGHDGHSAALAGLALELDNQGADLDVYLIFQHGEEIGGGGLECSGLILEKNISSVYAFHNWSGYPEKAILTRTGVTQCASCGLTVRFHGSATHASQPEYGISPVRAAAELALYLDEAPDRMEHEGLLMSTVVNLSVGSRDFGIAPGEGEVSATLRAYYEKELDELRDAVLIRAQKLAASEGLTVDWSDSDVFPETVNEAGCVSRVIEAAHRNRLSVISLDEPCRASEDFGYYQKQCPGAMFYIGNGEDWPPIHTADYDFNDRILETAVDLFLEIIRTPS